MTAGVLTADNAQLKPFFDRGGKIIALAGWADPRIAPLNDVNFYKRVASSVGATETDRS